MRNTNEQLQEIMRRAEGVKENRLIRKKIYASALATAICAILLTATAFYLPHLTSGSKDQVMQRYGSLLLGASYIGYVIVGILAFALGICATLLCIFWKDLRNKELKQKEQSQR